MRCSAVPGAPEILNLRLPMMEATCFHDSGRTLLASIGHPCWEVSAFSRMSRNLPSASLQTGQKGGKQGGQGDPEESSQGKDDKAA